MSAYAILLLGALAFSGSDVEVRVTTAKGETVTGTLAIPTFPLKTAFGAASIDAEQVASIVFGERTVVVTRSGTELVGTLELAALELETARGSLTWKTSELSALSSVELGPARFSPFAGEWQTNRGPLRLAQSETRVDGTLGWDGESRIEGKLDGRRFSYHWSSTNGPGPRGTGWLELWEDGKTITGELETRGEAKSFFGGYRIEPRRAEPVPGAIVAGQTLSALEYHLRAPKDFDPARPSTAIALFHGANTSAREYVETFASTWPELAERHLLVGFDAENLSSASGGGRRVFTASTVPFAGPDAGETARRQTDALVAEALVELQEFLPIERWFVGGHAQGGLLTYAVTMFHPELVAGAFPIACNLPVQCEPARFADARLRALQRLVPIAHVHGENDPVMDFSGAVTCHEALQEGGFPMLRLFSDPEAGHMFALLPVDRAVLWLEKMTSSDPAELLGFVEASLADAQYRDASVALARAARLAGDPEPHGERIAALARRIEDAARPFAVGLAAAMATDGNHGWVDEFWEFRRQFGSTDAARGVMATYARLRAAHERPASELFSRALEETDGAKRTELYREIVERYYASSYYKQVTRWLR